MARRSEQGNVLGFVLVGALLVALLLGGIYVVRHNISKQDGSVNVASNEASDAEKQHNESKDDSKSPSSSSGAENSSSSDSDSLQNALHSQSSSSQNSNSSSSSTKDSGAATGKLPETGPADTAASVVGMALLVGASVSYARSRRVL